MPIGSDCLSPQPRSVSRRGRHRGLGPPNGLVRRSRFVPKGNDRAARSTSASRVSGHSPGGGRRLGRRVDRPVRASDWECQTGAKTEAGRLGSGEQEVRDLRWRAARSSSRQDSYLVRAGRLFLRGLWRRSPPGEMRDTARLLTASTRDAYALALPFSTGSRVAWKSHPAGGLPSSLARCEN